MAKIICVGVAVIDSIFSVPHIPTRPVKVMATGFREVGGGMAATGAVAIRRLGGEATMWSRVADDDLGRRVIAGLAGEGVGTRTIRQFPGHISTRATVLVDPDGERLLAGFHDHSLPIDPAWLPLDEIAGAGAVLADQHWIEGAAAVLSSARDHNIPGVLDCDLATNPAAKDLVRLASHPILSEVALSDLTGEASLEAGLAAAVALNPGFIAATSGANGFAWIENGGDIQFYPAPVIQVVDTLGAGDVFHGAYALALAEQMDAVACARFATAAAALKCTRPGGREGAPTRAEVVAFMASPAFGS
ncbi:MAG: PfkB family carbohydrate kinase [Alphaproteobacteria bacterium]